MIRPEITLSKTNKVKNALALVQTNRTLWLDDNEGCWDDDKPTQVSDTLPRGRKLYIKHNVDGDIDEDLKFVACNSRGIVITGFSSLKDAIDWGCFDILDYTEECRELYVEECGMNDGIYD